MNNDNVPATDLPVSLPKQEEVVFNMATVFRTHC